MTLTCSDSRAPWVSNLDNRSDDSTLGRIAAKLCREIKDLKVSDNTYVLCPPVLICWWSPETT
jgi:hypothetical protein